MTCFSSARPWLQACAQPGRLTLDLALQVRSLVRGGLDVRRICEDDISQADYAAAHAEVGCDCGPRNHLHPLLLMLQQAAKALHAQSRSVATEQQWADTRMSNG